MFVQQIKIMGIISIIIFVTWFLSEFLLNRFLHSASTDAKGKDKNSLRIIWITIAVSMTAAGFIAGNIYLPISSAIYINYIGLSLIILGVILRLLVIRSLGKFFTVDVTIRPDHELKTNGVYKILRHPSYTSSLLSFTGAGLAMNNWISFGLCVIPIIIVFSIRIKVEEETLIENFGEKYIHYKKTTAALIPYIY